MDVLFEIFFRIVDVIAEIIGTTVAENLGDKIKYSVKGVIIVVIIGLVTWAAIIALGFSSFYLFSKDLAIAGFAVGLSAFFLIIFFIAVVTALIKKIKES